MAPLVVLILTFALSLLVLRLREDRWSHRLAGRLAIAVMFVFTGMSHFFMAERMNAMVPPAFPRPDLWVIGTGIAEILGGVALLIPGLSRLAAGCLIVLLLAVFPANVYSALETDPGYLWFRVPIQLLFLCWTVYFGWLPGKRPGA